MLLYFDKLQLSVTKKCCVSDFITKKLKGQQVRFILFLFVFISKCKRGIWKINMFVRSPMAKFVFQIGNNIFIVLKKILPIFKDCIHQGMFSDFFLSAALPNCLLIVNCWYILKKLSWLAKSVNENRTGQTVSLYCLM